MSTLRKRLWFGVATATVLAGGLIASQSGAEPPGRPPLRDAPRDLSCPPGVPSGGMIAEVGPEGGKASSADAALDNVLATEFPGLSDERARFERKIDDGRRVRFVLKEHGATKLVVDADEGGSGWAVTGIVACADVVARGRG